MDARDKSFRVSGVRYANDVRERDMVADTDNVRFGSNTWIGDVDIVTAGCEVLTGGSAPCDVSSAGCVVKEHPSTVGRVAETGCIVIERSITVGRVIVADCIQFEGTSTG